MYNNNLAYNSISANDKEIFSILFSNAFKKAIFQSMYIYKDYYTTSQVFNVSKHIVKQAIFEIETSAGCTLFIKISNTICATEEADKMYWATK